MKRNIIFISIGMLLLVGGSVACILLLIARSHHLATSEFGEEYDYHFRSIQFEKGKGLVVKWGLQMRRQDVRKGPLFLLTLGAFERSGEIHPLQYVE